MPPGSYRGRRLDFSQFTAARFQPQLFLDDFRRSLGCGFSALALLTGVYPEMIVMEHPRPHCSDAFMLGFLRRQGCRTWRLTQCALTWSEDGIRNNHVLLLSQLFRRNEGTWVVACDGMAYHNFQMYALDVLSLLNKPVLSAYLVIHPDWRNPEPAPPPADPATDTKKKWLSWQLLRPKTNSRRGPKATG